MCPTQPTQVDHTTQPTANPSAPVNKFVVLFIAALASFLTPFMGSSVNVALPAIARRFDLAPAQLTWIQTAYLLAAAVCLLPFGRLADIFGRKKIFTAGIALFTATSLACALAPSAGWLIAFRATEGVAGAMIFGTSLAILTAVFPPHQRGRALGLTVAAVYLGLTLGPFLGGLLTQHLGWRSIFFTAAPLGLTAFLCTLVCLRSEWAPAKGQPFDLPGALFYGASLVCLVLATSTAHSTATPILLPTGAAGLVAFILWQYRTPNPLLQVRLFHQHPVFALSNLAALLQYAAVFAVALLLSLFFQNLRGLSAQTTGLILLAQPILMTLTAPLAGWLSDHLQPRLLASTGLALTAAVLLAFSRIHEHTPLPWIIAGLAGLGCGIALFSSPNVNAVMGSVEPRFLGVAAATLGTMRLTGQMASVALVQLVFRLRLGSAALAPQHHDRFLSALHTDFLLFALLAALGTVASLARGRVYPTDAPPA